MDIDELEAMLYKWPTCGGMYMIMLFLIACNESFLSYIILNDVLMC